MRGKNIRKSFKQNGKRRGCSLLLASALVVTSCLPGMDFVNRTAGVMERAKADESELENPKWDSQGNVSAWDCVYFGNYWQEDTNGDGVADESDEKQPIKWRILDINSTEDEMLLMADKVLEYAKYNESSSDVEWDQCTIRSWLNGLDQDNNSDGKDYTSAGFINMAFTPAEQDLIYDTTVHTEGRSGDDIETENKLFFLLKDDVTNTSYGFHSTEDTEDLTKGIKHTAYSGRVSETEEERMNISAAWWLRNCDSAGVAGCVYGDGNLTIGHVKNDAIGVVPALRVKLSEMHSGAIWYAGRVSSEGDIEIGDASESVNMPSWSGSKVTWDCVYFGNYWQKDTNGDGRATISDDKTPIKWRVIDIYENDMMLMADQCLACQKYNISSNKVTYEKSTLRSWLNGYDSNMNDDGYDFYGSYYGGSFLYEAFSFLEREKMIKSEPVMCCGYEDYVRILEESGISETYYGFEKGDYSETRRAACTAYAQQQGAGVYNTFGSEKYSRYWLSSFDAEDSEEYADGNYAGVVNENGGLQIVTEDAAAVAVRPVIRISMASSLWSYAGTVTAEGSSLDAVDKNGSLELAMEETAVEGAKKYITGKIWAENKSEQESLASSLTCTVKNVTSESADEPAVLSASIKKDRTVKHTGYALFVIELSGEKAFREAELTVSASDGSKVTCMVTVEKADGMGAWCDGCFSVVEKLQDIGYDGAQAYMNGAMYRVVDAEQAHTKSIYQNNPGGVVAARVNAESGEIVKIDALWDLLKPAVHIECVDESDVAGCWINQIDYENGKFVCNTGKDSFFTYFSLSCEAEAPYTLPEMSAVVHEIDPVYFSVDSVTSYYKKNQESGATEVPFRLDQYDWEEGGYQGDFTHALETFEPMKGYSLVPGERQWLNFAVLLKQNLSAPGDGDKIANGEMGFLVKFHGESEARKVGQIQVTNQDMIKNFEKKMESDPKNDYAKGMNEMESIINSLPAMYDESYLSEYLTAADLQAIRAQLANWIYTINGMNLILDEKDGTSDFIKAFLTRHFIHADDFRERLLKKLGVSKSLSDGKENMKNTISFELKNKKKTWEDLILKFTVDVGYFTKTSLESGLGELEYTLSNGKPESEGRFFVGGSGQVKYTKSAAFTAALQKVLESQVKMCFKDGSDGSPDITLKIPEAASEEALLQEIQKQRDLVAESFAGTSFRKMTSAEYESGADKVFTDLKFSYMDSIDLSDSVKDVTVQVKREEVEKETRLEIHCPVNVIVKGYDGEIRAIIEDGGPGRQSVVKQSVVKQAYVEGDDKFLVLTDSDYMLSYEGNGDGTMTYILTEYQNGEPVRKMTYRVPLSDHQEYVNYLVEGRNQDISLYNLNDLTNGVEYPKVDEDKAPVPVANVSIDEKEVTMEVGQSHALTQRFEPLNATNRKVTWGIRGDDVVQVSESGVLYAKREGTTIVYVMSAEGMCTGSCTVHVTQKKEQKQEDKEQNKENGKTNGSDGSQAGEELPKETGAPVASASPKPSAKPTAKPSASPAASPEKTSDGVVQAPWATTSPTRKPSDDSDTGKPTAKPSSDTTSLKAIVQSAVKAGKVKTKGKKKYVITASASKKKSGQVTVYRTADAGAKSVTIPATVKLGKKKYKVTSIYNYAFDGMSALSKVSIGKNVKIIGEGAFANCMKLKFLLIPKNVTQIRKEAFSGCKRLKYLVVRTSKLKKVGADAFLKTAKSMKVKTPEKKWMEYAKLFKKNGLSGNALFLVNPAKIKYKGKTY